jgi:cell division septation protein DedD
MAATTRRARNYKEKGSGFTFGHFALPIAAVIALGLLFVGIKLFFLSPPERPGMTVATAERSATHETPRPLLEEPDFALADETAGGDLSKIEPETLETTDVSIVLAGPLQSGGSRAPVKPVPAKPVKNDAQRVPTKPSQNDARRAPANTAPNMAQVPASAAASGKWGVQIGAFVSAESASELVSKAKGHGYAASVSKVDATGKTFHRVRVGAGSTKEDASRLASELEKKGYPVSVVQL